MGVRVYECTSVRVYSTPRRIVPPPLHTRTLFLTVHLLHFPFPLEAAIALANMEVLLSTIATNLPETKVFLASILAINSKINNGQAADCGKNLNAGKCRGSH